jgi:hypothetical protein
MLLHRYQPKALQQPEQIGLLRARDKAINPLFSAGFRGIVVSAQEGST